MTKRPGKRGSIPGRGEKMFPLASVSRPGPRPSVSCTMGTGGSFPGVNQGRGVTLTTHPHLVPRSRISRSYTPLPLSFAWR